MDFKEYQQIIEETAVYPKQVGLAYCALGLTGEAGEVADKVKKLYRDDNLHTLDAASEMVLIDQHRPAIAKELGDVLWYITALANEIDMDLEEIARMNYDKLIKRRETNTLHGSGDDRENG
jgi:NTP pyrophosphatase (non-canonical NTP hydrolase)